ncbi:MAG: membrane protein insertase YidC [Halieaceae bacterium]|nr:membrane protein insertase YidC [Halieaceae bacterium]
MDIPRYALIAASILLGLMLLGEWTRFTADEQALIPASPIVESTAQKDSPTLLGDPTTTFDQSPQDDLPSDEDLAQSSSADIYNGISAQANSLVRVTTDVLEIIIDLEGGDVVGAALRDYPKTLADPSDPFVLLERNGQRTYVAQSGLVGPDGIDRQARALYRTDRPSYELTSGNTLDIDLHYQNDDGALAVKKIYRFQRGSHTILVDHEIQNLSSRTANLTPFAQLKRDSSSAPSDNNSGMGMRPFLGSALTHSEQRFEKFDFEEMAENPFKADVQGGWIAMLQHYFVSAWVPSATDTHRYRTRHTNNGFNIIGYTGPALTLAPGETSTVTNTLYVGPKNQSVLSDLAPHLDLVVDYGWLWWIAQPLFWLLTTIQSVVVNWGIAIIVLTLLVKLAFFQLSAAGYKSMARMRKVQPRIVAIRDEYANDKARQSQAMMELYKKEKINPLGGCFPILVQMPVFIALYWVLMESVELRQAPLALWIKDLSVMDPYFVLPILMGASMFYMQKLNPAPPDPMQAKIMQWMPIVFTFFFLWFPAGLVLYWLCNNLLSMGQQYIINRRIENGNL